MPANPAQASPLLAFLRGLSARSFLALGLLVVFPLQSFAHDLYILPSAFHVRRGQPLQVSFHNGDAFPESEVAPTPARLTSPQVTSLRGKEEIKNLRIAGKETLGDVTVPAGGSLQVSVVTVPNFIELAPDKFLSYLQEEGLHDVIDNRARHMEAAKPGRERYTKFAKSLLQAGSRDDYYKHPLGLTIEIVPLASPYDLRVGGKLPVQVLFRGQPAVNLQMEAARAGTGKTVTTVIGRTDANGRIDVPIDTAGKWRLHSLRMQRVEDNKQPDDPKSPDWESFWASLTFEIS